MARRDELLALLELAANKLGEIRDDVVFVGGCTVPCYLTDAGSADPRPTDDVDVVVVVATVKKSEYYQFLERLRAKGFRESPEDGVICRWRLDGLVLDVMPMDADVLGFSNPWYKAGASGKPTLVEAETTHK